MMGLGRGRRPGGEVRVRLAEMEGEACLYEAVVAALREDDDA